MPEQKQLPAPTLTSLEQLAQAHENEAFALLVEAIRDPAVKMDHRLRAAEQILDRARGKARVPAQKDPAANRNKKAISMSVETLMKIAQGGMARVKHEDEQRKHAQVLEAEFVPCPVPRRPRNEYALPAPTDAPIVPGTKTDLDDLLS